MKISGIAILLLMMSMVSCTSRQGITEVTKEQSAYFSMLKEAFQENRDQLESALEVQLSADRERQRELLQWERDLARAEVLLATPQDPAGAQKLLHMTLAQMDLANIQRVRQLDGVDVFWPNPIHLHQAQVPGHTVTSNHEPAIFRCKGNLSRTPPKQWGLPQHPRT